MLFRKSISVRLLFLALLLGSGILYSACNKDYKQNFSGAYKDPAKEAIRFSGMLPFPSSGSEGTKVRFKLEGVDTLQKINIDDIQFLLNGLPAAIESMNPKDSTVTIVVPNNASSGAVSLIVRARTYFGPQFKVNGNVWIDSTFNRKGTDQQGNILMGSGANGTIKSIHYEEQGGSKSVYILGSFSQYNGEPSYISTGSGVQSTSNIRALLKVDPFSGAIRTEFTKGEGPNGELNGMIPLNLFPGFLIYGSGFSLYNKRDGVNNMTRIYEDGKLDSIVRNVYNPNPLEPEFNIDTMPQFIGGFNSTVIRTFLDHRQRLISIGNFTNHRKNNYDLSTYTNVVRENTYVAHVAAMNQDGLLDTTYNYDNTRGQILKGANSGITDAIQIMDGSSPYGKIIIAGRFTNYNNVSVQRIAKLDENGQVDPSFAASANGEITRMTYNPSSRKILVMGSFTMFNGLITPNGLVMINEDGSLDQSFQVGEIVRSNTNIGQLVTYAGQLKDGRIVISGNFEKYKAVNGDNFITRQGFMILNKDGSLVSGLNNTGAFNGIIYDMLETTVSATNTKKALILVGRFSLFDNADVGNIVKIGIEAK